MSGSVLGVGYAGAWVGVGGGARGYVVAGLARGGVVDGCWRVGKAARSLKTEDRGGRCGRGSAGDKVGCAGEKVGRWGILVGGVVGGVLGVRCVESGGWCLGCGA